MLKKLLPISITRNVAAGFIPAKKTNCSGGLSTLPKEM